MNILTIFSPEGCLKKNHNTPRPSEHPPVMGEKMSKRLGGIKRLLLLCFSSHPFWTSSSLDVPAGVTQEEGHTGFLMHLLSAVRAFIFLARRIQPFLSLVNREVEFCVVIIIIIIIINGTLARSLEPVVTECKEHTIRTQTKTNG